MKNDPHELNNLVDSPEQAKRITAMTAELETWKNRVGDPLDNNNVENSFKMMGGVKDHNNRPRDKK